MPDKVNTESRAITQPYFRPGEIIESRDLNTLAETNRVRSMGVNYPSQAPIGLARAHVYQFQITANDNGDFLTCRTWDGFTQGTLDYLVAKPYLLQQSTLETQGRLIDDILITFAFTGIDSLTATNTDDDTTEDWKITMDYDVGDIIYAIGQVRGGIDQTDDDGNDLSFIDINVDGRAWAKV